MADGFLHGVEFFEKSRGPRPIQAVRSSVIGLIGTAPTGAVNQQKLCLSDTHAAQFGPQFPGFTIPQALDAIFDHGHGTVIVINVLDTEVHKTDVENETVILDGDSQYCEFPVMLTDPVVTNSAGSTTYVLDTDYTVDPLYSKISRKAGGAIAANATLKVDYTYADPSKVTASDIIGGVNLAGERYGLPSFKDSKTLWGFKPKLLLAPGYCTLNSVAVEMAALAELLKGQALIDAPIGTTYEQALQGRGIAGTINFATGSQWAIPCWPHLLAFDPFAEIWDSGATVWDNQGVGQRLEPMSQRLAGLISKSDNERGSWYSPSNQPFLGVTGVETKITEDEANLLNAAGIVTYDMGYGTGILAWGNRNASFPANTLPSSFISVRREADLLHEAIGEASRRGFIDLPINDALIDFVIESVNTFIRTRIAKGALIDGKCSYDPTKNSNTELALGHLTFDLAFLPPPPAERITFESYIDINLFSSLKANGNG